MKVNAVGSSRALPTSKVHTQIAVGFGSGHARVNDRVAASHCFDLGFGPCTSRFVVLQLKQEKSVTAARNLEHKQVNLPKCYSSL
jgi:hypothetical protein